MVELIESVRNWIESFGLSSAITDAVLGVLVVAAVVFLSVAASFVAKRYLLKLVDYLITKTDTTWDDALKHEKVFQRLSHLAPAIVFFAAAGVMFPNSDNLQSLVKRFALAYMVIIGCLVVSALLNAVIRIYRTTAIARDRPIKAYLQVLIILVYVVTAILVIGVLLNKSPWGILTGLGAMTAIVMLVFKDSILGFVASIQLAMNNMVRVGDWIEMPKFGADGDVVDVSLASVKVQNWDKTITTIPTYALISDSFKNWRGMTESAGRRIKRSVSIDLQSVSFCTPEMLERFRRFEIVTDYIEKKGAEIESYNKEHGVDESEIVNGRRMSNLGVFRIYVEEYLKRHPQIHTSEMTFLVRQLAPRETGIPIEVYVFSKEQRWAEYEAIQADIFDHILAVIPEFELSVFQNPSGRDFRAIGNR